MSPEEQLDEARAEEAYRQWQEDGCQGDDTLDVAAIAARLARENWTPPEPEVDPDVLAFREWAAKDWVERYPAEVDDVRRGNRDGCDIAKAFLAGARMAREQERGMAREQERGRANMPIGMAGVLVDRCQRMMHSLPPGVRAQWDAEWGLVALCREVAAEIAKYMGEA